jgi:hypothetical protein
MNTGPLSFITTKTVVFSSILRVLKMVGMRLYLMDDLRPSPGRGLPCEDLYLLNTLK